jgi:ribosome-binding factor A
MSQRVRRVCEILKRELSTAITREITFAVPLVTISSVDMTPDLKQAHVYISAMGTEQEKAVVLRQLEAARVTLQADVSRRVVIKNTPHLFFHLDTSIERGTRVLAIMDELGMEIAPDPLPVVPNNPDPNRNPPSSPHSS